MYFCHKAIESSYIFITSNLPRRRLHQANRPIQLLTSSRISTLGSISSPTPQNNHARNHHLRLVPERPPNAQLPILIAKINLTGSRLLQLISLIQVQRPTRTPLSINRNPQLEVLLPQLRRRVRRLCAQRNDRPTTDMQRNRGESNVRKVDGCALADDPLVGEEVVEDILRKIDRDVRAVLLGNGANEEGVSEEKLEVDRESVGVGGVLEEERGEERHAGLGLAVEVRVDVVEEAVARVDGVLAGFGDGGPVVKFLGDGVVAGVVPGEMLDGWVGYWGGAYLPVERVEGAQPGPAGAECLGGVVTEAADVSTDHGDLEDGGELKDTADGVSVVVPCRQVVS